jgi:hypothetical protein
MQPIVRPAARYAGPYDDNLVCHGKDDPVQLMMITMT